MQMLSGIAPSQCPAPVSESCWPEGDTGRQGEVGGTSALPVARECAPDVFFHPERIFNLVR